MRCINITTDAGVVDNLTVADTFVRRLVGLLGRRSLDAAAGLLITPCQAVHTMFMQFPIDVVFLDNEGNIVRLIEAMQPWKASPIVREAVCVLELPAGKAVAAGLQVGQQLKVES